MEKNKDKIVMISLLLLVFMNVVLLMFQNTVKYNNSKHDIDIKSQDYANLKSSLVSNESKISSTLKDLEAKTIDEKAVKSKADSIKNQLDMTDFELNIPSLLIDLETNAKKLDIDLVIEYNEIAYSDGGLLPTKEVDVEIEEDEVPKEIKDEPKDGPDDIKDEQDELEDAIGNTGGSVNVETKVDKVPKEVEVEVKEPVDDKKENKEPLKPLEPIAKPAEDDKTIVSGVTIPNINGISVATIPLVLKGSYESVRSYVKYLDTIELLEPTVVQINSEGSYVEAAVVINVFYRKGE